MASTAETTLDQSASAARPTGEYHPDKYVQDW
jgi:hypothetical protein